MKFNLIFALNQLEFLLIQLKNTLLLQIFQKGWISVSNFFQCTHIVKNDSSVISEKGKKCLIFLLNFNQTKQLCLAQKNCHFSEGKQLATSRECKFIETSSGIQHNVDELLVGILKQIRLRELRDRKLRRQGSKGKPVAKLHGSKTALSLNLARDILHKMCLNDSKSKSCENLHVL